MICKRCGKEVPHHWSGLCGVCDGFDPTQTSITRRGLDRVRGTGVITRRERSDGSEYAGTVTATEPTEEEIRRGREVLENGTPDDEGPEPECPAEGATCSACGQTTSAPRKGDADYVCIKCALDVPARERVCAICGSRVTDHYAADGLRLCRNCAKEFC